MTGDQEKMLRRQFIAGVSTVSLSKPPKIGGPSVEDALITLEKAVRREIAGIEEIRISYQPDDKKRIALLFSVVRRAPIS